jgi:hypothetical protein
MQAMKILCIFVIITRINGQVFRESYFQKIKACEENDVFPVSPSVTELHSKIGKSESVINCASLCLGMPRCDGINVCKNSTNTVCQSVDIQNPISCGDIEERDKCYFLIKVITCSNKYISFHDKTYKMYFHITNVKLNEYDTNFDAPDAHFDY